MSVTRYSTVLSEDQADEEGALFELNEVGDEDDVEAWQEDEQSIKAEREAGTLPSYLLKLDGPYRPMPMTDHAPRSEGGVASMSRYSAMFGCHKIALWMAKLGAQIVGCVLILGVALGLYIWHVSEVPMAHAWECTTKKSLDAHSSAAVAADCMAMLAKFCGVVTTVAPATWRWDDDYQYNCNHTNATITVHSVDSVRRSSLHRSRLLQ